MRQLRESINELPNIRIGFGSLADHETASPGSAAGGCFYGLEQFLVADVFVDEPAHSHCRPRQR
jgi:hypothetical protein